MARDFRFYEKPQVFRLKEISDLLGVPCEDYGNVEIGDVNSLEEAQTGEIAACFDKKTIPMLEKTKASVCLTSKEFVSFVPQTTIPLCVKNPRFSFAKVGHFLYPSIRNINVRDDHKRSSVHESSSIAQTAFIGQNVEIGKNTIIGPGAYIGDGTKIGDCCRIYDNVTLLKSIIGNNVFIHSGARVGSEGFGFVNEGAEIIDIPHLGRVVIKDNVRIGANTAIDRGVFGDTLIEEGCRIDNLVQIAHNVRLGKGCIIVSQVGIAGSTVIGDFSVLAGQAGLTGHLKIGKGVTIAAQSGVIRDIEDGETVGGSPAMPIRDWHRQIIYLTKVIKK